MKAQGYELTKQSIPALSGFFQVKTTSISLLDWISYNDLPTYNYSQAVHF